jgi:arabinofuranan 3-O-arabinosyltransferase
MAVAAPAADLDYVEGTRRPAAPDRVERLVLACLFVLLVVVVFANSWGVFTPDTVPELYLAPGRLLAASLSTWLPSGGEAGSANVDTGIAPLAAVLWVIRSLGASAWVAMRIWRLLMYVTAAWGIRRWFNAVTEGNTNRAGRLAVTVFYVANPFVVVSGSSTPEMLPYAVLPWMLLGHLASMREPRSWRKASLFALGFFAMSGTNSGIIPLFLILAVPCQMLYYRVLHRTAWRDLWASFWRCGVLAFGLSLYWVAPSVLAIKTGSAIVAASENPTAVAQTSSWAEISRLQGLWPLYGRSGTQAWVPSYLDYLTNPVTATASYLVAVVAALAAWFARSRRILLAGILLAVGIPVMIGQFPPNSWLLWPQLVKYAFAYVPGAAGFRTTVKVGPLVVIAYTLCIGLGGVALAKRWSAWRRVWRWGAVATAVALVAASVSPTLTGNLWATAWNIPGYWATATKSLDAGPATTRVMLVPGSVGSQYRWGDSGPSDIAPMIMSRQTTTYSPTAANGDMAANFMAGWDTPLSEGILPTNSLSVIARYVGASQILLRNDQTFENEDGAPTSVIDAAVDGDSGLSLSRSYGAVGEYTTLNGAVPAPLSSPDAQVPPLQIYNVSKPTQIVRTQSVSGEVLIDGDGFAVPTLANLGILNGSQVFQYMGSLTAQNLEQAAEGGATIVLTDTNRRRDWTKNRLTDAFGPTLRANQPIQQGTGPSFTLFQHQIYAQTVEQLNGAISIDGTPPLFGLEPYGQPEQAFDSEPSSPWLTGGFGETGMTMSIDLAKSLPISEVDITPASGRSAVTAVRVKVGNTVVNAAVAQSPAGLPPPPTPVHIPTTTASNVSIEITGVSGGINQVGFSHVSIPGAAQVSETTALPTTYYRLYAQVNPATQARLARLPLDVVLTRQYVGSSQQQPSEELSLDRSFDLPQPRFFTLTAVLQSFADLPRYTRQTLELRPPGAPAACFPVGHMDGVPVMMALAIPVSQAVDGGTVPLTSCGGRALALGKGRHTFASEPATVIDGTPTTVVLNQMVLASAGTATPLGPTPAVHVTSMTSTKITLTVARASRPYFLVSGQADESGWSGTLDGQKLGPAVALDGYTFGWRIDSLGPNTFELSYGPQLASDASVAVSGLLLAGILVGVALPAVGYRQRRHRSRASRRGAHGRRS